jgi:hypothetical protein
VLHPAREDGGAMRLNPGRQRQRQRWRQRAFVTVIVSVALVVAAREWPRVERGLSGFRHLQWGWVGAASGLNSARFSRWRCCTGCS